MDEDEIWYEPGDQSVFDDGYTVWKGREQPDKIAVTDTAGTAEALCMHNELVSALECAVACIQRGGLVQGETQEAHQERMCRAQIREALRKATGVEHDI